MPILLCELLERSEVFDLRFDARCGAHFGRNCASLVSTPEPKVERIATNLERTADVRLLLASVDGGDCFSTQV